MYYERRRWQTHGVIIPSAVPLSETKNFQLIVSDLQLSAQPHLILPPRCLQLQQVDVFIGKTQINLVHNNAPAQTQSQRQPGTKWSILKLRMLQFPSRVGGDQKQSSNHKEYRVNLEGRCTTPCEYWCCSRLTIRVSQRTKEPCLIENVNK